MDETSQSDPLLSAGHVSVALAGRRIVEDVCLEVRPGEMVAIAGPNGAGKTTLLRALAGLLPAEAGRITLEDRAVARLSRRELARVMAYLPQETATGFALRVDEVVRLGRYAHRGPLRALTPEDTEAVRHAMELADVTHLAPRRITTLSGGERRRVFIARAMAQQPRLLLLDEPTSALDVGHACGVMRMLEELAERGQAIVLTLHELTLALRGPSRLLLLDRGRVLGDGPPEDVLRSEAARAAFGVELQVVRDPPAVVPR
jgi:iron complex transport system ATP-binding protein